MRGTAGKFAPKSDVPRKVRSINVTDAAWEWLATVAQRAGMSRNDYLEALASGNPPFMETASDTSTPFMETEALRAENEQLKAEVAELRSHLEAAPIASDCVQNRTAVIEAVTSLREAAKRKAGMALIREVKAIADKLARLIS